ncbi:MAG: hypothetical protein AAGF11_06380 [Myxococcota bacterium]
MSHNEYVTDQDTAPLCITSADERMLALDAIAAASEVLTTLETAIVDSPVRRDGATRELVRVIEGSRFVAISCLTQVIQRQLKEVRSLLAPTESSPPRAS